MVHIVDGDTLDLLVDEEDGPKKIRIRLQGIDCPEGGQPWGKRATEYLSDLVFGETVEVLSIGDDWRDRLLGRIYVEISRMLRSTPGANVGACGPIPTRYRLGTGGDSRVRWGGTKRNTWLPWMANTG